MGHWPRFFVWLLAAGLVASIGGLLVTTGVVQAEELVVYSGRGEPLVGPLFDEFTKETGIEVAVRYGGAAELAATILEEGKNTPADVYWAQDAGALGALAQAGRFVSLDDELLERVDKRLRSPQGLWVATSGRARVVAYNTDVLQESDLPESIWGFTDPKWKGRIGWAPTNGSFQAFVTALRVLEGDARAQAWLRGIEANDPKVYRNNSTAVEAVGRGEVHVGFVNHYYLYRFLAEHGEEFPVRNYHTKGDAGAIINVAGVGILDATQNRSAARRFIAFLLSREAQLHFTGEVYEYPVLLDSGIELDPHLVPLEEIDTPDIDLGDLKDLEGTLEMLQRVGVL